MENQPQFEGAEMRKIEHEELDKIRTLAKEQIRAGKQSSVERSVRSAFHEYGIVPKNHEAEVGQMIEELSEEGLSEIRERFRGVGSATKTAQMPERGVRVGKDGAIYRPENGYQPERD